MPDVPTYNELVVKANNLRNIARRSADLLFTLGNLLNESDSSEMAKECFRVSAKLLLELEQVTNSGITNE